MRKIVFSLIFLCFSLQSASLQWSKVLGTDKNDYANSITKDYQDNIIVSGITQGSFDNSRGLNDLFIVKLNSNGETLWNKQYGTLANDSYHTTTTDQQGNIFATGTTEGIIAGEMTHGWKDFFLAKFDKNGNRVWIKQFGTDKDDIASSISIFNDKHVYITGKTKGRFDGETSYGYGDIFLAKFNLNGEKVWIKQFGSNGDEDAKSLIIDSNENIYITGHTGGNFGGSNPYNKSNIFVTKIDSGGNQIWTRQLGTEGEDESFGITIDNTNNIYVTGYIFGKLSDHSETINSSDIYIAKLNTNGELIWEKQFGALNVDDSGRSISYNSGNLYLTGETWGSINNQSLNGEVDIFFMKIDTEGNFIWSQQFGGNGWNEGTAIFADANNNILLSAISDNAFFGNQNIGMTDTFIAKYNDSIDNESIDNFIIRLYEKIFSRQTDPSGFNYWKSELGKGRSAADVAKYFFRSDEFANLKLNDEDFLKRTYSTLLNREADPEGLAYWLDQMQNKGVLRDQIFYGFALSSEFQTLCQYYGITAYNKYDQMTAFIERFYNLVLARSADAAGLQDWLENLDNKTITAKDLAKGFLLSEEFINKGYSNTSFIKVIYKALLNRDADESGLNFWLDQLENQGKSRENLIDDFAASSEFDQLCDKFLK